MSRLAVLFFTVLAACGSSQHTSTATGGIVWPVTLDHTSTATTHHEAAVAVLERRNTVTLTVTESQLYLELNGTHLSSAVHAHPVAAG